MTDTRDIATKLIKDKGNPNEEAYVYMLGGAVGGVMVLDDDLGCMRIKFTVTHPGTQLVGSSLLEAAVERSCQEGYPGCLELISHSDESSAAYEGLRFVKLDAQKRASHRLSPAQAAQWKKFSDTFELAKHLGKKFIG